MTLARLPHRNDPARSTDHPARQPSRLTTPTRRRHRMPSRSYRPAHTLSRHPTHPLRSATP